MDGGNSDIYRVELGAKTLMHISRNAGVEEHVFMTDVMDREGLSSLS